ncbi:bZIP protein [Forsythia ovata]|uniref:BZIP protein n=1 Tax=Forsythia ovata TaxID=205694 RepID=A0ABD1WHG4_9LAMI
MSRQAHLPPRCPEQKKTVTRPAFGPASPTSCNIELHPGGPRHHKSISQSSILEEQPAWLNDLLSDSDSNSSGILHRRAASDSFTLLDGLVPLPGLDQLNGLKTPDSCEPDNEFESGCAYGPNSPRRKDKVAFPENAVVSALSEYLLQSPLQHLDATMCVSGTGEPDSFCDAFASASGTNTDTKLMKRHPGQRSRVRKLQYIAELERTVDILQNLESELAVRVASLYQQRIALSIENNTLKQQVVTLQKERFNSEGEYHSLKKEYERLKMSLAYSSTSKLHGWSNSAADLACSGDIWQTIDMGKLDLN